MRAIARRSICEERHRTHGTKLNEHIQQNVLSENLLLGVGHSYFGSVFGMTPARYREVTRSRVKQSIDHNLLSVGGEFRACRENCRWLTSNLRRPTYTFQDIFQGFMHTTSYNKQ